MGYTHYFFNIGDADPERWARIFPQLIRDTTLLINNCGVEICGPRGQGPPIVNEETIQINGPEGRGSHETFTLYDWGGDKFCKTARKPYDVVVTAVLLRAHMLFGEGTDIRSDGNWDEWIEGRQLVERLFPGEEVTCPWAGKGGEDINGDDGIEASYEYKEPEN
ncbi:MAG: hypothetical protein M1836_000539 [Candelina mexicana]|nr:MAG: hypothetical protein M1836_000539 [Candelina mexicana]